MLFSRYKRHFRRILIISILVIILGSVSLIAYLVRYSSTSTAVCKQCHLELISLWKNSKGHPPEKAKCFDCHSMGFKLFPKNWNIIGHARDLLIPPKYLADDDLTSQRCLDCHQDVLNFGYQVKKKVIQFTHRYHIQEGLSCVDCHRGAGHEYMEGGTNRPSISDCLNCHLKEFIGPPKNQKCLNCHDVMLAPGNSMQFSFRGIEQ